MNEVVAADSKHIPVPTHNYNLHIGPCKLHTGGRGQCPAVKNVDAKELEDKVVTGVFVDREVEEYSERYARLVKKVRNAH